MNTFGDVSMSLQFSNGQWRAVDAAGTPLQMVDPRTGNKYVLVEQNVFDKLQSLFEGDLTDTYPAQIESAMRADWDDPIMDEYNDYDRHRQP
jgi:hypothetical protein